MKFYGTDEGNKLINEDNYPKSIIDYLYKEREFLIEVLKEFEVLVEVGCMEGRNMDLSQELNKYYVGIDIVDSYIQSLDKKIKSKEIYDFCEAYCLDANKLKEIKNLSEFIKKYKSLFYFPFNSFGNMDNPQNVISNMVHLDNSRSLIFSYDTDDYSTNERKKYYENCSFDNLRIEKSQEGVRFLSDNGLNTIAYDKNYLCDIINKKNLEVSVNKFCPIGLVYSIKRRN